ncbi:MAG: hypothetical protein WCC06_12810 [Candidatus Aminicenantales bacterium]
MARNIVDFLSYYFMARYLLQQQKPGAQMLKRLRAQFYVDTWKKASSALGFKTRVFGRDIVEIFSPGQKPIRIHNNYLSLDDSITVEKTLNRRIIHTLLTESNIPIPRYFELEKFDYFSAKRHIERGTGPVVVKPTTGTGSGSGVTTNIDNMFRLIKAIAWAKAFCPSVIIEDQIEGDTYRLLYLNGELLECVIRRSPTVIGDGRSTIRRLVREENRLRIAQGIARSQSLLPLDYEMANTLRAQGLSLHSVPAAGQVIKVRTVINRNLGIDNESIKDNIAPSILEMGHKITEIVDIRYAGIDIITPDITQDLSKTKGIVLEVNAGPGLYYHYFKKDGPTPIAEIILRKVLGLQDDFSAVSIR